MQKQREHYELSLKQQEMMEQELEISKKGLERHRSLLNKGGVSESQIEEAEARAIQSERSYTGFAASLKSAEITMIMCQRFKILVSFIFFLKVTLILTFSYLNVNAKEPIKVIDLHSALTKNIDNSSNFDIISKIKYVKPETNKNCIIGEFPRFFCADDFIIANSFQKILIFNKNTGEFYKEIGKFDKSPNGYKFTLATLAFNEKDKIIYAGEWNSTYCGYNFKGRKTVHIKPPFRFINSIGYINDSLYAGFVGSNMGGKKMKMAVFNKNGDIINI